MKENTRLINKGLDHQRINGKSVQTVNPPIYTGSTVLFDNFDDFSLANSGQYPGITYGTDRLPNQRAFENALCALENGAMTRAFPSGISAITHVLTAFAQAGDHILICDNVYGPTAKFSTEVLSKFNVEIGFIPAAVGPDIDAYIKPNTRLIFLESPGSNTFEIQDIPAVTGIARQKGIITVLDNTWATPLYLKPFDLGVDIIIQSVTKYISGHSDVLLGTATINDTYARAFDRYYSTLEIHAPAQECSLALRGLKTLGVRLAHHEKSALKIAKELHRHPRVDQVLHPALADHPEHHLWKRDFTGASGLFAFTFKQGYSREKMGAFANALELFGLGFSWGGFKSLITIGKPKRIFESRYEGKDIVRLNIGLEDGEDLMADLERGFACLK